MELIWNTSTAIHTCELVIAIILSSPAVASIFNWLRHCSNLQRLPFNTPQRYQDEDGEATLESMQLFAVGGRLQRAAFACGIFIGSIASFVRCFHPLSTTTPLQDRALQLGIWSTLMLQALGLFAEPSVNAQFSTGIKGSANSLNIICALALDGYTNAIFQRSSCLTDRLLVSVEFMAAAIVCLQGVLLPRRPDVFWKGSVVDRQLTSSFLCRLSFSWPWSFLQLAPGKKIIGIEDLPELDYDTRSQSLLERLNCIIALTRAESSLWRTLAISCRRDFIQQLALTIVCSLISFGPQVALLGILRAMENRREGDDSLVILGMWVASLSLSIVLSATAENWNMWLSGVNLGLKMQKRLTMAIFDRLLRVRVLTLNSSGKLEDDSELDSQNGRHRNLINLVAVDAQQVGNGVRGIYRCYEALVKLVVAGVLIGSLLGWRSLAAGAAIVILLLLISMYTAKGYSQTQSILMIKKDHRMALVTEALRGIRQIKFSGWESSWEKDIQQQRNSELDAQRTVNQWIIAAQTIYTFGPILLSVVTIAIHVLVSGDLKPSVAFTSLSVLGSVGGLLGVIPDIQSSWLSAWISLERLQKFLQTPENYYQSPVDDRFIFDQAAIRWPGSGQKGFTFSHLTLDFPSHALSVIVGPTRSGKSLLLAAILGECDVIHGEVKKPASPRNPCDIPIKDWLIDTAMAYVAQTPWIENASIKENILFGLPENSERYQQVLFACALSRDLSTFEERDRTEIGPKGVNISGGQRSRIALARALYSRAGVLVMDDIFSAVDAHTAQHLCTHALCGPLAKDRTRILVTHHFSLCAPHAEYIVSLTSDGKYQAGRAKELFQSDLIDALSIAEREDISPEEDIAETESIASSSFSTLGSHDGSVLEGFESCQNPRKYIEDEEQRTVGLQGMVLVQYLRQIGGIWYGIVVMVVYVASIGSVMGQTWWIAHWTHQSEGSQPSINRSAADDSLTWYLGIYIGISGLACATAVLRNYLTLFSMIYAARNLFEMLLHSVLRAPLDFLDRNPVGRILNRFSADIAMIDTQLGSFCGGALTGALEFIAIFVAGTAASWWVLPISVIMLLLCAHSTYHFYVAARNLKHLDSISRSPVFERFGSIVDGLPTIRAHGLVDSYRQDFGAKVDDNTRALWNLWLINCWFGYRMALIGAAFVTVTTFAIISVPGATVAITGFALSFLIRYTLVTSSFIRNYINLELALNNVDRVLEYAEIPSEAYDGQAVPAAWPQEGRLDVSHLVVRHSPHLPPVLDHISFQILPSQRVGVVGRTGAGKSSLAMALFRFLEAEEGSIILDGIDISTVPLHELRHRLAVIPQDPHLFSGTVRSNLDPFEVHTDLELFDALDRVHWTPAVAREGNRPDSSSSTSQSGSSHSTLARSNGGLYKKCVSPLDEEIVDAGRNLSLGQRQQLCLARAIASRPKILVMDEATSSIDQRTDNLIQESIREAFGRDFTTLLVIAHRISTVIDFDRILVLDEGRLVEFGSPQELIQREGGHFRALFEEYG